MPRKLLLSCLFCGLGSLAIQAGEAQTGTTIPSLVGSWEFTLTPNASPTPRPPIPGLATFTSDGSVIETDTSEVVPVQISAGGPILRSTPGHGIWQPSPVFGSLSIKFISLIANPNATLHSKKIVTMMVTLNSTLDQFSGSYSFEFVDPTGHAITTVSGTVAGQLMVHPLLPQRPFAFRTAPQWTKERWQTLGMIGGVVLVLAAHTYREENGEEVIRLISARKATPLERRAYEENDENSD